MFNNFQNIFKKYTNIIDNQEEIQEKVIKIILENTKISLTKDNLKLDIKNKTIKIINLPSSQRFYLLEKMSKELLGEKIKKEMKFKVEC